MDWIFGASPAKTKIFLRSIALIAPVGASAGRETARWRIRGRASAAARSRRSAFYAAQADVGPLRGARFLDDLRGQVAHLLQLMHEGLHLLQHVLALQLHGLVEVLRFGEPHRQSEIRLGIEAGDLGDLGVERIEARAPRWRAVLERLPRLLTGRDEGLEGPSGLLDAHLHEPAQRFRNLRLHECVIGHATLLLRYLPSVLRRWLRRRRLGACGPLARGLLH